MVISLVELQAGTESRKAMLEVLRYTESTLRTNPTCLGCEVYEAVDKIGRVLYVEKWRTTEDLHRHIRSPLYLRILNAFDLAQQTPTISFHEVSATSSIELIEELRSP